MILPADSSLWPFWAVAAFALSICGCPKADIDRRADPGESVRTHSTPVRVLVVDDPELAEVIQRQWQARAEGEIQVLQAKASEIVDTGADNLRADAIIYPAGMIGELAERELIVPISDEALASPQLNRRDVVELARLHEVEWGQQVYAVPFGSPQFTLFYRVDVFRRLGLSPPVTWAEYQAMAERLSEPEAIGGLAASENGAWYAVIEPLGPGWAGQVLLARAAAYARHRNQYSTLFDYTTMKPLIAEPPFVRALDELVAAARLGPADAAAYSPHDARRDFLQGRCAMALSWPTAAKAASPESVKAGEIGIGFAELPGSQMVYNFSDGRWESRRPEENPAVPVLSIAGRLGSVTNTSRQPRSALNVLAWLSGNEWSRQIATQSPETTLYRAGHFQSPREWGDAEIDENAAQQYANVVIQRQTASLWLFSVRIPGRGDYLAALDDAVHEALGGKSSQDALRAAAERWGQITEELGVERQRQAYARSLGLEP